MAGIPSIIEATLRVSVGSYKSDKFRIDIQRRYLQSLKICLSLAQDELSNRIRMRYCASSISFVFVIPINY